MALSSRTRDLAPDKVEMMLRKRSIVLVEAAVMGTITLDATIGAVVDRR